MSNEFCNVCKKKVNYRKLKVNEWPRDHLRCPKCNSMVRQRALMYVLELYCPNFKNLEIHQSSPGDSFFDNIFKKIPKYSFSHYFPNNNNLTVNGFLNINIEDINFPSNKFDLFFSLDVFEHIFNPIKAIKEIYRVLKPGGIYLMTVPIENSNYKTEKACELLDGKLVHIPTKKSKEKGVEIEYHGNPIDNKGSVVTYYYGYDIVDIIKHNTDFEVQIFFKEEDLPNLGITGVLKDVIVCKK